MGAAETEKSELWQALRSEDPVGSLVGVVTAWERAGCTQTEAQKRLTAFLDEVMAHGKPDEDEPVRDVPDFVVGYCSPQVRIFL